MNTNNLEAKLVEKGIMYQKEKNNFYRITKCKKIKQKTPNHPTHNLELTPCDIIGNLIGIPLIFEIKTNFDMDADIANNLCFSTLDPIFHTDNHNEDFFVQVESNDNHYFLADQLKIYLIKYAQYFQYLNKGTGKKPKFDLPTLKPKI